MSTAEIDDDDEPLDIEPVHECFVVDSLGWERFKGLVITAVLWGLFFFIVGAIAAGAVLPQRNMRHLRFNIAMIVGIGGGLSAALWRYATTNYRLLSSGDILMLQSPTRSITIDPQDVQGLVGLNGVQWDLGKIIIWKQLLIIAHGKTHAITLSEAVNTLAYHRLRETCVHAWGLPYPAQLETPSAGPELDPDEYLAALRLLRNCYAFATQRAIVRGVFLTAASSVILILLVKNIGWHRIVITLLLAAIVGLMVIFKALGQIPVLLSIHKTERQLRAAIGD